MDSEGRGLANEKPGDTNNDDNRQHEHSGKNTPLFIRDISNGLTIAFGAQPFDCSHHVPEKAEQVQ
jgi:hypothetical protein